MMSCTATDGNGGEGKGGGGFGGGSGGGGGVGGGGGGSGGGGGVGGEGHSYGGGGESRVMTMRQIKESRDQLGRVVHVKGFNGGLGDYYWEHALAMLDDFDTIAWDGDGYRETSFTELVVRFLRKDGRRRAVAFKLGTEAQEVSAEWAHVDVVDVWPRIEVVAVDLQADYEHYSAERARAERARVPNTFEPWMKDYVVLGRAAILATGSKRVVCLGGGGITKWEAEFSKGQGIFWTVFAISRGKKEEKPSVVDWAIENLKSFDQLELVVGSDPEWDKACSGALSTCFLLQ